MKKQKYFLFLFLILSLAFSSCRKAQEIKYNDDAEANFTYIIRGDSAFFSNTSVGLSSYNWNFGDGSTSSEANPMHVYPGKGDYLVTLSSGETKANTLLSIDKSSPVRLDDGTLDDWNTVTSNVIISGGTAGVAMLGKFDYDANFVYFYIEQASTLEDGTIITAFFNTDQDNETGFYPGSFTNLGVDHYFEGQLLLGSENWLDPYSFAGDDDHEGWNWEDKDFGEFWKMGHYIEDAGTVKYEFALDRNKFPGLKNDSVTIGISILDADWSDIGYLPDGNTPGYELNLNE